MMCSSVRVVNFGYRFTGCGFKGSSLDVYDEISSRLLLDVHGDISSRLLLDMDGDISSRLLLDMDGLMSFRLSFDDERSDKLEDLSLDDLPQMLRFMFVVMVFLADILLYLV